jgi:N-methylhydantoinase A
VSALISRFEDEHERLYGVRGETGSPIEIRALRVGGFGPSSAVDRLALDGEDHAASGTRAAFLDGQSEQLPIRSRASFGERPEPGPLLVDEYDTTVVVRPGWSIRRDPVTAALVLERGEAR